MQTNTCLANNVIWSIVLNQLWKSNKKTRSSGQNLEKKQLSNSFCHKFKKYFRQLRRQAVKHGSTDDQLLNREALLPFWRPEFLPNPYESLLDYCVNMFLPGLSKFSQLVTAKKPLCKFLSTYLLEWWKVWDTNRVIC